ncbi:glycoside hydrolase family 97 protein [Flavihumibacter stibioxidans]|nr:glycoside hydrolase family 97 protein [Flavihumibacter stibioxidans]
MQIMNTLLILLGCNLLSGALMSQERIVLHSQNSAIRLDLMINANGVVSYSVHYKDREVVAPSTIGFSLKKPAIELNAFECAGFDTASVNETWEPAWGEEKSIRNNYKQLVYKLTDKNGSGTRINLIFRIFDEGVGFRYEFPVQPALEHFIIGEENTRFHLGANHTAFWIPGDYDSNEYLYNTTRLNAISAFEASAKEPDIALKSPFHNRAVQTPLMLKTDNGLYINIHEAALLNYPAMNLVLNEDDYSFTSHLVPDAVGNKAYLQTPFRTPWRTIIISDDAREILSSRMILNLNEPSVIKDPSWIRPQKFIGMWWEMHVGKASWQKAGGKHGANTANVKNYIDFASANRFDGVLVEGWNEGWEDWFGNWKEDVFDFVTPYSDYDINYLTSYAREKGVRLIMHHETSGAVTNYERHLDTAFRLMRQLDINTVKTGYVGRIIPRGEHHDGQWMVNHYQRVAEKAAKYRIMVDAHESVRPTGLHRTYPNWMANEAARGNEFNNAPALGLTPEHETILPFTRMMGGPMDYTPGFFRFRLNQFDSTRKTRIRTTIAKQLALFVTMYSPLMMAGDLPGNYSLYPDAFDFIKDVPVDWDDTRILAAEPGDYVAIARKAKAREDWYIGLVTDENSRRLELNFNFLDPKSQYEATIYADAADADWNNNPAAYTIKKQHISARKKIKIAMAPGGGCAIVVRKK